ncbi:MAG TPA: sigma-70 family RNA polymerase sigma factor [Chloroflexota bacterium]|nr:sigma-70 family RNA polymerase sigma factor [Chloroflexota bacterium]
MPTATAAENVLQEIQRGHERAIDELVIMHQNGLYSYVLAMLRDRRDAEEVAQDVFIRAIRAIRTQYTDEQIKTLQVRPWLLRIARNLALNRLRARKSRPITDSLGEGVEVADTSTLETAHHADEDERLRRGLERLEWQAREWLELRFINDLTYAEIAALKGGTEAAARGKVFRAIASLRQLCTEDKNVEM